MVPSLDPSFCERDPAGPQKSCLDASTNARCFLSPLVCAQLNWSNPPPPTENALATGQRVRGTTANTRLKRTEWVIDGSQGSGSHLRVSLRSWLDERPRIAPPPRHTWPARRLTAPTCVTGRLQTQLRDSYSSLGDRPDTVRRFDSRSAWRLGWRPTPDPLPGRTPSPGAPPWERQRRRVTRHARPCRSRPDFRGVASRFALTSCLTWKTRHVSRRGDQIRHSCAAAGVSAGVRRPVSQTLEGPYTHGDPVTATCTDATTGRRLRARAVAARRAWTSGSGMLVPPRGSLEWGSRRPPGSERHR